MTAPSPPRPPPRLPPGLPPRLAWALVSAVYLAGSVVLLMPLPAQFTTHVWGDRFDAWTTLWLMDHLHHRLADGSLTTVTTDILFPVGYNLWSFGHAALQILGVGLMFLGLPLVPAYNTLLLLGFATSGLGAHILGRSVAGDHRGGFVAGIVFATSPYLYGEGAAGCIELVAAGLVPLYAWSLVELVRRPDRRRAAISAGLLAIVGPFNWYYTLFAGMLGVGFVAWQLLAGRHRAALLAVAAMACAALADAPLIPLVRRETPSRPPLDVAVFEDPVAWDVKDALSNGEVPLADLTEALLEEHDAMQVIDNSTTVQALRHARFTVNPLDSTPGALAFLVGIAGAFASGRRGLGWLGIAAGATLLTVGPFLRLTNTPPMPEASGDWPLPYYFFYQYLPFFSKAYRPYRIGVVALTACAALGAAGLAALRLEVRRGWIDLGLVALGVAAFTQPYWAGDEPARRPLADATIPPIYAELAALPEGGVIELPLHYQPLTVANARFQYNQVLHRHPTLNCNQLIRRTDLVAFRDYVLANPFLATLVDIGRRPPPLSYSAADVARAAADGFRYIVLHTAAQADDVRLSGDETGADLVGEPAVSMLYATLGEPVLQDERTRVFRLPDGGGDTTWTWTGADVVDLDPLYDARLHGLAVPISPDSPLPLYRGPARQVSLWVRIEGGSGVVARVTGPTGARDVPLSLDPAEWRWQQIPVEGDAEVTLTGGPARVWVTRLQVTR